MHDKDKVLSYQDKGTTDNDQVFITNSIYEACEMITAEKIAQVLDALDTQTSDDLDKDYKRIYYCLFNGITDIINRGGTGVDVIQQLKDLQCAAEKIFIDK